MKYLMEVETHETIDECYARLIASGAPSAAAVRTANCEHCEAPATRNLILIDGVGVLLCDACYDERTVEDE